MSVKAVVTAISIVIMLLVTVFIIEIAVPLTVRANMNTRCRGTLLSMEINGGLIQQQKISLEIALAELGFTDISITGTNMAKHGDELHLRVEGTYMYSHLMGLFTRGMVSQVMIYERMSISRKVVN